MRTYREIGWEFGRALEMGNGALATSLYEHGLARMHQQKTVKDYSLPLSEICNNARIVTCWSEAGIKTVEDFYRTRPDDLLAATKANYSSSQDVEDQSRLIENAFSPRLHGRLYPAVVRKLLAGNVITVFDVCSTRPTRLRDIVGNMPELRQVSELQKEFS